MNEFQSSPLPGFGMDALTLAQSHNTLVINEIKMKKYLLYYWMRM